MYDRQADRQTIDTHIHRHREIHRLTCRFTDLQSVADKFKDHQRGLQTYILTHRLAGKQNYRQSHSPHTPT